MSLRNPSFAVSRRSLIGGFGSAAAAAAITSGLSPAGASSPRGGHHARRPNFLLVVADDLGRGEVGAYGQKVIATPVLDRLARQGTRFDNAYATPSCAPTRCSLFTGKHTGHAAVKTNGDAKRGLLPEDVTVGEVLQGAGYETAIFGKWGLGPDIGDSPSHPNRQGFDHFFGYIDQTHCHDYWPTYLWRNGERLSFPENEGADVTYAMDLVTEEALGFLDNAGDRPFFLDVSYTTPHAPNEIPDKGQYADKPWPQGEINHAAQVTWTDTQIGLLLDKLEERGLDDNTVVIVVSDNGPHAAGANMGHVGSKLPHDPEFFDSNGSLRGIKFQVYEGGIRVPLITRVPGQRRGRVVDESIAIWDLLPTLAELAGTEAPADIDGISFARTLRGRHQRGHDHLYWQIPDDGLEEAVRFGDWKAVRHDRGAVELYNLGRDGGESTDLSGRLPQLVRRAERYMEEAVR